ncbi:MAG: precorrin-3B synthase [Vulcanimicrobiaceae bacterium]
MVSARAVEPGGRDRCPGAVHAIAATDGALVRVRIPGGYLGATALGALATIAERYGDGRLDITARANVQLRGLLEADLGAVALALAAAGMLPSIAHERVRNIVASPFAGADPSERVDVRPLVAALDRELVSDAALIALPPKFLFAIDGGGRGVDARGADIAARVSDAHGHECPPRFTVRLAGDARCLDVGADDLVAVMLALARRALVLAAGAGCSGAAWRLADLPRDLDRVPAHLTPYARPATHSLSSPRIDPSPGTFDSREPDRVNIVPAVSLGRLSAFQARVVALLAREHGADVRLGGWHGIAIVGFPRAVLELARERLAAADLALDSGAGFLGVAACAGRGACDAAGADVRRDAARYASLVALSFAEPNSAAGRWNVNFAGCEKRCAMRRGGDADLVATANGYDVWLGADRVATSLDADAAIAAVAGARASAREAAREPTVE